MKQLILIFTLIPMTLLGQGWEKTFGGEGFDKGQSVQQTTDGCYIITGQIDSFENGGENVTLIKVNNNGDTLWTKTYGGEYSETGMSVRQTTDGGYIIAGKTFTFGNALGYSDVYLIKTDLNGDTLWTKTFGGMLDEIGLSVQQTNEGGYIISGSTDSFGNGSSDMYLIKTNSYGETLWTKTYGGEYYEAGMSVQQTTDGGYILTGMTSSFGVDSYNVYLIKTSSNGDTLWTKTIGGEHLYTGNSIQQTTDGGYIISGSGRAVVDDDLDVLLIKTDINGETIWTNTFGGQFWDYGYSAQQTIDGGYIITGSTPSNGNSYDVYLIKTDNIGDTLWTKTFGGVYDDRGVSVQQTTDGGFIVTGSKLMPEKGATDIYLIKTDEYGIIVSTTEIPIPNLCRKRIKLFDLSGREIIKPQKNIPYIELYDDGTSQKKMNLR